MSEKMKFSTWCARHGERGKQLMKELIDGENEGLDVENCSMTADNLRWKCSTCGTIFESPINMRHRRTPNECPTCGRTDMTLDTWCTLNGEVGQRIQNEIFNALEIKEYSYLCQSLSLPCYSHKYLKFKCQDCGNIYEEKVDNRISAYVSCPKCRIENSTTLLDWCEDHGKFGNTLIEEFDTEVNNTNGIFIDEITFGSAKEINWKCKNDHVFNDTVIHRTSKYSLCPVCFRGGYGVSYPERFIYYAMNDNYENIESNVRIDICNKKVEFDIVIPEVNTYIEYNGAIYHTGGKFENSGNNDQIKIDYCKDNNINFIRVNESTDKTLELAKYDAEQNIIWCNPYFSNYETRDKALVEVVNILENIFGLKREHNFIDIRDNAFIDTSYVKDGNSALDKFPELESLWDCERNGIIKPENISFSSHRKVWIKCNICKESNEITMHEYAAGNRCFKCKAIRARETIIKERGTGLKDNFPELEEVWNTELNNKINHTFENMTLGSFEKVHWKCCRCGRKYIKDSIRMIQNPECPSCGNNVLIKNVEYIKRKNESRKYNKESWKKKKAKKMVIRPFNSYF